MSTSSDSVTLVFQRGQATADELNDEIRTILDELRDPQSDLARQAIGEGLDPARLGVSDVAARELEQGFEPILTTIAVTLVAEYGKDALTTAWRRLIWPAIEKRRGGLSLGPEVPDGDPAKRDEGERDSDGTSGAPQ